MKKCIICGVEFQPTKRSPASEVCSHSCNAKNNTIKRQKKFMPNKCATCGKELKRLSRLKYCSLKCSGLSRRGKEHPCFKGKVYTGKKMHPEGYVYLLNREHPFASKEHYILEHRMVVEEWLNKNNPLSEHLIEVNGLKCLRKDVVVHHLNGLKADNRIENLGIYASQSKHIKEHCSNDENWYGRNLGPR